MIDALIVDDEQHNIVMLRSLINENFPDIRLLDYATNADEAYTKINLLKPRLLFLDIVMQGKSGFDLLRMFTEIGFEVIFVSAYNEFAITAFKFNALGYILKPIDYMELQKTVKKAVEIIEAQESFNNHKLLDFVSSLEEKSHKINKISVHHNNKVVLLGLKNIVYVESEKDFCKIRMTDGAIYTSTKELNKFDDLLHELGDFIKINRSSIVNINYIKSYSKGNGCEITVSTGQEFEVSRRRKAEIISILKEKLKL